MIELTCGCGRKMQAPDEKAGKRGRCPLCGAINVVPLPPPRVRDEFRDCPHCLAAIDPPPPRSRKCPHCREPIVLRLKRLLKPHQAAIHDEAVLRERRRKEEERRAEAERYIHLPEQPVTPEQYRQIWRRNAYLWATTDLIDGRIVQVDAETKTRRLRSLKCYSTGWFQPGIPVVGIQTVEDRDMLTGLSYGRINLHTGWVAWRREPYFVHITRGIGSGEMDREIGEYYRTFEPPAGEW